MGARLTAALLAGRTAAGLSRRFGIGGGTVISGHVVPRIAPDALTSIVERLPRGSIVLSGTNGKTTTARLLAHLLSGSGIRPLHNRAGANLLTGLLSAVVEQTTLDGQPRADVGVFEVDEATLPIVLDQVVPRVVLLTNIFRDQLDRYGEVQFIYNTWRRAFDLLRPDATLVLNADDPMVAALGQDRENVLYFGLGDPSLGLERPPHAADARLCMRCGGRYEVSVSFYGHLGYYRCPSCGLQRPEPQVVATNCQLQHGEGTELRVQLPTGAFTTRLRLPGLYNVYNALAASAVAHALGIAPAPIGRDLETFTTAFGRLERIAVEERQVFLALVKNPVGFTEVIRTVVPAGDSTNLAIFINDRLADGTDVSWLWDVDFELLQGHVNVAVCSGTRAEDLAVRLKYAGVASERIVLESDPRRALEQALARSDPGETIYVLPTYTAMLEVRDVLRKTGYVGHFYED
jgi:UDP-N-acetylmuramyl tripeptide synthase